MQRKSIHDKVLRLMDNWNQIIMPIKWRLKAVMADREMSYRELAQATGLHRVTVNKLVNTYEMPPRLDRRTLEKFCRVLQCQPGDLLRYTEEEDSTPK